MKNDIYSTLEDGKTELHLAVQASNYNMVQKLLNTESYPLAVDIYGQTALHWAAFMGNPLITELLLQKMDIAGVIKAAEGNNNYTALHLAVQSNNLVMVEKLLNKLGDTPELLDFLKSVDTSGQTALHWAASMRNPLITELLLQKMDIAGVIKAAEGNNNYTALHLAVQSNNLVIVEKLLNKLGNKPELFDFINSITKQGQTVLHIAASYGCEDVIDCLYQKNSNFLTMLNSYGWNPVFSAIQSGHIKIVKKLLDINPTLKSTLIDSKTNQGDTLLHIAASYARENIIDFLYGENSNFLTMTNDRGWNPVFSAIYGNQGNQVRIVKKLLDINPTLKSTLINSKTSQGETLLHIAASYGREDVIDFLYGENSDFLTITNDRGCNPLFSAIQGGHIKIVKKLLDINPTLKSTLIDSKTNQGDTLLHIAASYAREDIIDFLYGENSGFLTMTNDQGWNPVFSAIYGNQGNQVEIVKKLFDINPTLKSTLINSKTKQGETLLHIAAVYSREDVIDFLYGENSGFLTMLDNHGWNPVFSAIQGGHIKIVKKLLDINPTLKSTLIDSKTNQGDTLLHVAASYAREDIIDFLYGENSGFLTMTNDQGWNPVFSAIYGNQGNQVEIVKKLLDINPTLKSTLIDSKTNQGDTLLNIAAAYDCEDVIAFLSNENTQISAASTTTENQGLENSQKSSFSEEESTLTGES